MIDKTEKYAVPKRPGPRPGLYVHVPFCRSKCPYCDFYSVTQLSEIPSWLEALEKEAVLYRDRFSRYDSLYLGGGNPSLLDEKEIRRLMGCLKQQFSFTPDCEVTLEANPDDITRAKLKLYRDLGINRLSLGVQSFDDQELLFLGRRHTAGQSEKALNLIRATGFGDLGIDLLYGLPGQGLEQWEKTLAHTLSFRPEHLSCYQLTVEPETELGRRQAESSILPFPEEEERAFFLFTSAYLEERGYVHYEISNFARGEKYFSHHNRKYWRHLPYLGLGPAAHSFDGRRRWWNHRSLAHYCQSLAAGEAPVAESETLSEEQVHLETLYLGLRTREGVSLEVIRRLPHGEAVLLQVQGEGWLQVQNDRILPTRQGLAIADRLPLFFDL
jgi:oxygen-independent coproporphyrinogen-3 oxidase